MLNINFARETTFEKLQDTGPNKEDLPRCGSAHRKLSDLSVKVTSIYFCGSLVLWFRSCVRPPNFDISTSECIFTKIPLFAQSLVLIPLTLLQFYIFFLQYEQHINPFAIINTIVIVDST